MKKMLTVTLFLIISLTARAEVELDTIEVPTLCVGDELNSSFSQGVAITLEKNANFEYTVEVHKVRLYGFHIAERETLIKLEGLRLMIQDESEIVLANQELQLSIVQQEALRWKATIDSKIEQIGVGHKLTCSNGKLNANIRQYLP
ncbi:MAG: hypothetical protein K2Q18_04105 [Bdellovibrionales bacterium]|nr:hypothetical protein [Bdellovibrionales bacterium]